MNYHHRNINGQQLDLPLGKVVCVGRNYVEHAKELNNPVPSEPILFIKPATTLVPFSTPIDAQGAPYPLHYELEIAILIKDTLKNATAEEAKAAVGGVGLALDLTYRCVQSKLKEKGHPWEKAKAFDDSCPTSEFVINPNVDLDNLALKLEINGEVRQSASASEMIVDIVSLLQYASTHFSLVPGDILLTGTPAGVGVLKSGDALVASLDDVISTSTQVV
ncbi:fumarylacetoacetate hydrolase family protein [Pseudoalteromonas sp. DL2-H2.2]|uniref:fumarylacetoacetate hydrolase family protein n=1 Tax=Pseudoalteromonas sp. DL2-H2.2 TaxID=2908889 RepID=UPI001F3D8E7E|nr:fumarylacetoacetate hydrolase family protein [Pseudoalteromonas sp. DL2-H2.2]MCF2907563.1 fumarylacetoacetate hydrolase family protein [Pseudoalteromonas sp. DL2-H2.2]